MMPITSESINSEYVFVLEYDGYIFHILITNKQVLCVFKKDEFKGFFNEGTVIAFHDHHKGLDVLLEGKDKIVDFMKDTLPIEQYLEFEKWEMSKL